MSKVLVFGHKNPDTDTICSAIVLSYLVNELGGEAEPVALGEANPETAYALKTFGFEKPRVIQTAADEVDSVMLVDHNEFSQSVDDIEKLTIKAVVDHHRIANFQTADPLYYRAEPLGATASILYKLFQEYDVEIPKNLAGLMLSAIISDSLLFKSPTFTEFDRQVAYKLAELADVDVETYGLEMLKAGTDISNKSATDILNGDAKTFEMNNKTVRIGQVNVVEFDSADARKDELVERMKHESNEFDYDLFILLVTNILEGTSIGYIDGSSYREVEVAFDRPVQMNLIDLPGVVSRKKQVVPQLTKAFENK